MRWVLLAALLLATATRCRRERRRVAVRKSRRRDGAQRVRIRCRCSRRWRGTKQREAYDRARDKLRTQPRAGTDRQIHRRSDARARRARPTRCDSAASTFDAVLTSRSNALSAGADKLAPRIFANAEAQFRKAAINARRRPPDKSQSQAVEAVQSYRTAELDAIKGAILRDARHLLDASGRRERRKVRAANAGAGARVAAPRRIAPSSRTVTTPIVRACSPSRRRNRRATRCTSPRRSRASTTATAPSRKCCCAPKRRWSTSPIALGVTPDLTQRRRVDRGGDARGRQAGAARPRAA